MEILCVANELSEDQSRKTWSKKPQFLDLKNFDLQIGQKYQVYGINILNDETWVYILSQSKYLIPVPLCLFEIVDRRMSKHWVAKLDAKGDLDISYPTIVDNPYYLDDLSEYNPETIRDFQQIQELLNSEFAE